MFHRFLWLPPSWQSCLHRLIQKSAKPRGTKEFIDSSDPFAFCPLTFCRKQNLFGFLRFHWFFWWIVLAQIGSAGFSTQEPSLNIKIRLCLSQINHRGKVFGCDRGFRLMMIRKGWCCFRVGLCFKLIGQSSVLLIHFHKMYRGCFQLVDHQSCSNVKLMLFLFVS